ISVKPYPKVFQHLIRDGVVGMEGLTWLHILDAEPYKRVRIHGIPEIVKPRTDFYFALPFVSEGIVWVDRYKIISNVDRTLIAVLTDWDRQVEYSAMHKNAVSNLLWCPLQRERTK